MSPRAFVVGATGFLGSAICTALRDAGFFVVGTGREARDGPWDAFVAVDLSAPPAALPIEPGDVVVNAAGLAHDLSATAYSGDDFMQVNAAGAGFVAAQALAHGAGCLVHLSSVKAIADETPGGPMTEASACHPVTPYGESKLAGERAVVAALDGRVPVAILRLCPVYGPGSKGNLDRLVRLGTRRRLPLLPRACGHRSMIHVDDVADLVVAIAQNPTTFTAIVGDGEQYSPRAIQEHTLRALGQTKRAAVPASVIKILGAVGTAAQRASRRAFPFTTADANRLLHDALYEQHEALPVAWKPQRTLWQAP
jgi:nucleoside-diphosphate-sugar epimerase